MRNKNTKKNQKNEKIWFLILGKFPLLLVIFWYQNRNWTLNCICKQFWGFLYIFQFYGNISVFLLPTNQTGASVNTRVLVLWQYLRNIYLVQYLNFIPYLDRKICIKLATYWITITFSNLTQVLTHLVCLST